MNSEWMDPIKTFRKERGKQEDSMEEVKESDTDKISIICFIFILRI